MNVASNSKETGDNKLSNQEFYKNGTNETEAINVRWIIHTILEAKAVIVLASIILLILALFAFFFLPLKSRVSVEVLKIPTSVSEKYKELNTANRQLKFFNLEIASAINQYGFAKDNIPKNDITAATVFDVSASKLLSQFTEKIVVRSVLVKAIEKHQLIKRSYYASEEKYQNAVIENAYDIDILPPAGVYGTTPQKQSEFKPNLIIEHSAKDGEILRNAIFDALEFATQEVKQDLINNFKQVVSLEKTSRQFLIDNIDQYINLKIDEYDRAMEARVIILKEQAELARVLGISKNALEVRSLSSDNKILAIQQSQIREELFFRGYEALEHEIAQIKERENNVAFISSILPLETLKLRVSQDKTIERLEAAFSATPILSKDFEAANYQKFGIKITPPSTKFLIPAIIFIFGLFATILVILLRRFLKTS